MENIDQHLVNISRTAVEHHIPCHGTKERREHIGDVEQRSHQAFCRDITAAEEPGVENTHDRP